MKIGINKHKFYNYILACVALVLFFYYIWFRFIRERLPKEIPFNLTFISFIFLCVICLSYAYLIFKIILKNKNNSYFLKLLLIKINNFIKPLIILHNFFLIKLKLNYFIIKNFTNIIKKYNLYEDKINLKILLIFDFLPKLILLFSFIFDVFYLKNLNFFYYFLILGIIPIFYNYCIYNFTTFLEILLKDLEKNYYVKILSTYEQEKVYNKRNKTIGLSGFMVSLRNLNYNDYGALDIRYFIGIQVANLIFQYDLYEYTCIETTYAREMYTKEHNIQLPLLFIFEPESDYISKKLTPYFFDNMEKAIYLQAFLEVHNDITKPTMIEKHSLFILIGYFIGWIYILVVSLHTLDLQSILDILVILQINIEPFSGLEI